ncbi:MAG: hypothetical protein P8Q40_08175 [Candidatus Poseidonia sp.]|uniref:hypothetical protein n=1 Tax=Poseidonia sp. TaxID=2666344 RepID=UPI0030BF8DEA|nr:hypothetical protein [Poseidonia sp.]
MTDLAHAQSSDMTVVSRVLIAAMFCGSVVSIIVLNRNMFHLDVDIFWGSTDLEQGLRSVYRLSCGYLGFHAIMFWMIRNPVAGEMTPLFRESNQLQKHSTTGVERLVPFSSWTLLAFSASMLFNGMASLLSLTGQALPAWIVLVGGALFGIAFSSAALTAIIVRYVILPDMVERKLDMDHMFLKHEQMMHNFSLIFLSIEMVFGWVQLPLAMVAFGFLYGSIYLIFAEYWAVKGGGYYVYEFIDTRPKSAPFLLLGLVLVCAVSFSIGVLALYLRSENVVIGTVFVVLFLIFSTRFIKPSEVDP